MRITHTYQKLHITLKPVERHTDTQTDKLNGNLKLKPCTPYHSI